MCSDACYRQPGLVWVVRANCVGRQVEWGDAYRARVRQEVVLAYSGCIITLMYDTISAQRWMTRRPNEQLLSDDLA
jgi:hypothetical protein